MKRLGDEIPDRVLAILTLVIIGFVLQPRDWIGYAIGLIVGGLVVFVFMANADTALDETPDPIIRRWIEQTHYAHAPNLPLMPMPRIDECTEPECEAALPVLAELKR